MGLRQSLRDLVSGNGLLLEQFTGETADTYLELGGPDAQTQFVQLEIRHSAAA